MTKESRMILAALSIVAIIVSLWGYSAYQGYKEKRLEKARETQRANLQKQLADKYGALTDWNKDIRYTIQLQDLLVKSGKPVLFTGFVDDVFVKEEQYYVRFLAGGLCSFNVSESQICFVLRSDSRKASKIMNRLKDRISKGDTELSLSELSWLKSLYWQYAVVAKIENVTRPVLRISRYWGDETEEVEFEYKPSDIFVASGSCIDFIYIGKENNNISK